MKTIDVYPQREIVVDECYKKENKQTNTVLKDKKEKGKKYCREIYTRECVRHAEN